jgi:Uma2 family endonuclease
MGKVIDYPRSSKPGEPVWELATLYPYQGEWTVDSYLKLKTTRLIEYDAGKLEFLTMPTRDHQQIVWFLAQSLKSFLLPRGGDAWFAPIRVRVADDKFREPDLVAFLDKKDPRAENEFFSGADLVMEVVSEGSENRERDYIRKRADYEAAGIPEYWIIDPEQQTVTVLALHDGKYVEHAAGVSGRVGSALMAGFQIETKEVFTQS